MQRNFPSWAETALATPFAGLLFAIAILYPAVWVCAIAGLALLIRSVLSSARAKTAALRGYLFGLLVVGASLVWVLLSYPTDWLGIPGRVEGALLVGGVWVAFTLILSLPIMLWGVCMWRMRTLSFPLHLVCAGVLWIFFEYIRATLFSAITWAPGTPLGPHYSFGFLGNTLAYNSGLLWAAQSGGVWALGFVGYVLAGAYEKSVRIYEGGNTRRGFLMGGIVTIILLGSLLVPAAATVRLGASEVTLNETTIHLIQTDFPRSLGSSHEERIAKETNLLHLIVGALASSRSYTNLVVLPEDSRFYENRELLSLGDSKVFNESFAGKRVVVIDSGRTNAWDGAHNEIHIMEQEGTTLHSIANIRKILLAPFGEYMPSAMVFFLERVGRGELLSTYELRQQHQTDNGEFNLNEHIVEMVGARYGILECSEVVSTTLYPSLGGNADVLINVSSLAWTHGSPLLFNQLVSMALIHTTATGKPYIQATNMAPTVIVLPYSYGR